MIPKMDETQAECFRLFVELGDTRTINKLLEKTQELELGVTKRQLVRWSTQHRWVDHAKHTSAVVASKVEETLIEDSITRNRKLVNALRVLQDRFIERIGIDPNDPNLSDVDRARAIDPDFRDFSEAVKQERLILGDPTERREDVLTSRLVVELGENELLEAARAIASKRYGLPTQDELRAIAQRTETIDYIEPEQVADQ